MKKNPRNKNVYVVELSPSVLAGDTRASKKFLEANPNRDPDLPCVYVGQTGLTPEARLAKHLEGIKSGKGYVTRFGLHLRPDLYEYLNPMTWKEALKTEKTLAERLRAQGYAVWQN